ncbi:acyl-CoA-binding domain-containing protein 3-like [Diospyros lotus]|uniref:acyl-CoA-binding domain-containing protein 3-like n=1 Tax=Diospyros lotus TaxID=55363 RepID=UPI00224F59F6|nr:acyl-CoA-binding domain-containing protein 3-like [Diospyros lotus]
MDSLTEMILVFSFHILFCSLIYRLIPKPAKVVAAAPQESGEETGCSDADAVKSAGTELSAETVGSAWPCGGDRIGDDDEEASGGRKGSGVDGCAEKVEVESDGDLEREDGEGSEGKASGGGKEEEGGLFDDWEGVERTELEKRFGQAVVFVGSESNADCVSRLDSDVADQLFGLHKVAIEGPCRVPQPMALMLSARAKWNAWKQLGDISREDAMEQYVTLLSRSIPGWMGEDDTKDGKLIFLDAESSAVNPSSLGNQPGTVNESMSQYRGKDCGVIGAECSETVNKEQE